MARQLLSSGGKPLSNPDSPPVLGNANKMASVDRTLTLTDMNQLDFVPIGHYVIGEAIAPDSVTEGGIHTPFGTGDKPLYRILRMGQRSAFPGDFSPFGKGDVVFDRSVEIFTMFHNFPRLPDGSDRLIGLIRVMSIEGVWGKYRWADAAPEEDNPPMSPDRQISLNMVDFEPTYVRAVLDQMMNEEDLNQLDVSPVGSNIIVEHAPVKNITGSILTTGNAMPLYRVLRVPDDKRMFPEHLKFIAPGDFVMITMLDRRNELPHSVKTKAERQERRRLYMSTVGHIVGWYPSLSWRFADQAAANAKVAEVNICDETHCADQAQ